VGNGQIDVLTLPGTSIARDPQGATQVYVYFPNEKKVYARRVVTTGISGQISRLLTELRIPTGSWSPASSSCVRARSSTPKRLLHEPD